MKLWPFNRQAGETKALSDDLLAVLGGPSGGYAVSASEALKVPAVAAAVRTISEAAACLDVDVVYEEGAAIDHPVAALLKSDVNPWTSGFDLVRDLVADALTRDAGGLAWVNRVRGEPREIIKYDAGCIDVTYDSLGTGQPSYRMNGIEIDAADVVHLRGAFSRCPLTLAREAIGLARTMEAHAGGLFRNGARPGGVIEFPGAVGEEALKRMRAGWRAAHEGEGNTGRTAILWDGAKFSALTMTSTDAQFLELRRFQIEEIGRAFNLPVSMLGDLTRATWSNASEMQRQFLQLCLEPWLRALEAALSRSLFSAEERGRYRIVFARDDFTNVDLTSRATAINSLVSSRVLSPNEARSWLDLPPREGGDTFSNPNIEGAPIVGP